MPISHGASPVASASGFRLGATPRGLIHPNIHSWVLPPKPDISTLLGLGHFYFGLTLSALVLCRQHRPPPLRRSLIRFP